MTDKLVAVAAFASQPWAAVAAALLEQHGIHSVFLDAEGGASTSVIGTDWIGGIKIAVPASRVDDAQRILAKILAASETSGPPSDSDPQSDSCLRCGKTMNAGETRCHQCGWSFKV